MEIHSADTEFKTEIISLIPSHRQIVPKLHIFYLYTTLRSVGNLSALTKRTGKGT
jgi:hypothetical protein